MWDTFKTYVVALADEWEKDNVNSLSAALAYYATFSLVPTIILVIAFGSMLFGEEMVREELFANLQTWGGTPATTVAREALAGTTERSGTLATILGGIAILLGATQLFSQLQDAMNRVWEVKPQTGSIRGGIKLLLQRRLLALALVVGLGVLVIASLIASMVISFADQMIGGFRYWEIVNFAATYTIGTVLLALMFQYMPAVELKFRDVRLGAALTVALLMVSKYLLSLYVAHASISSTYGAAGTLIAFLLWVYVSCQIVLIGAEFTQVHCRIRGREVELSAGSVRRYE